jgi:hypothetical protein
MSDGPQLRVFDYVNHPYTQVRDCLVQDANAVFQAATNAATSRAESVAAELRVNIAGLNVTKEIQIQIVGIEHRPPEGTVPPTTILRLRWQAATGARWFPAMTGQLSIYPLTGSETQLDFTGVYQPPLGAVGKALNAVIGHRIADASVHHFIQQVAAYLRRTLPTA